MRQRFDFLEWRPDRDELNTEGLQIADNVVHETEGYKQVLMHTAGANGTISSLTSAVALREVPIGTGGQTLKAWLSKETLSPGDALALNVAVEASTTLDSVTSATVTSLTDAEITSLAVAELDDNLFITCEAAVQLVSGPGQLNITGYVAFNP